MKTFTLITFLTFLAVSSFGQFYIWKHDIEEPNQILIAKTLNGIVPFGGACFKAVIGTLYDPTIQTPAQHQMQLEQEAMDRYNRNTIHDRYSDYDARIIVNIKFY